MKKRLLVADDDPSVSESLKKVLEGTGYEVTLAADGSQAEVQLRSQPVDLLILDLNMPNRDGWDVLETVASSCPLLPVIVITGMMDQLESAEIPGAAALMAKPVEVLPLLKTIEGLLAESDEQRISRASRRKEAESWHRGNR